MFTVGRTSSAVFLSKNTYFGHFIANYVYIQQLLNTGSRWTIFGMVTRGAFTVVNYLLPQETAFCE